MNLYHLRYFVTLAHISHYTIAAQELGITQPSLSHAISSLEGELGIKLFEKSGRNIELTKYGKNFLNEIEPIIDNLDKAVEKMQFASKGNDSISLSFLRVLGVSFVPKLLKAFTQYCSNQSIYFTYISDRNLSADIIEDLKNKKIEIAFCSKMDDEEHIEYVPVCHEGLVLIVPPNHPLADRECVTLEETMDYEHVFFSKKSGLSKLISDLYMDNIGKLPPISLSVAEDHVVSGFVANGFGIAVVPDMVLLNSLEVKKINLDIPEYSRIFYLCYLKDTYQSPIVKKFISFVKEYTKDLPCARDGITQFQEQNKLFDIRIDQQ